MAKIYVKFNAAVLREIEISKDVTTFGRKPGNDVVIENPAVSGFHGRIIREGDQYYIEDLNSTNGTYLNGQRVKRAPVKNHDQISVARHVIEFITDVIAPTTGGQLAKISSATAQPDVPVPPPTKPTPAVSGPVPPSSGLPETSTESPTHAPPARMEPATGQPVVPEAINIVQKQPKFGNLRFISGADATTEIVLKDLVTYVGSADQAVIKLKGFMVPSLAAAISKRPEGYFLKAIKPNYPKVNGASVKDQILLEPGALIEFGGLAMVFQFKDKPSPDVAS